MAQSYASLILRGDGIKTTDMVPTGDWHTGVAKNIDDVAYIIAYKTLLNDGSMWFVDSDESLESALIPENVTSVTDPQNENPNFKSTAPKSWAFVIGIPKDAPASTTPLFWSYGLDFASGAWGRSSPYGGEGGYVGFLDGHVIWVGKLSDEPGLPQIMADLRARTEGTSPQRWVIVNAEGKGN
jgi:hypothetical protein